MNECEASCALERHQSSHNGPACIPRTRGHRFLEHSPLGLFSHVTDDGMLLCLSFLPASDLAMFSSCARGLRDYVDTDILWAELCALKIRCFLREGVVSPVGRYTWFGGGEGLSPLAETVAAGSHPSLTALEMRREVHNSSSSSTPNNPGSSESAVDAILASALAGLGFLNKKPPHPNACSTAEAGSERESPAQQQRRQQNTPHQHRLLYQALPLLSCVGTWRLDPVHQRLEGHEGELLGVGLWEGALQGEVVHPNGTRKVSFRCTFGVDPLCPRLLRVLSSRDVPPQAPHRHSPTRELQQQQLSEMLEKESEVSVTPLLWRQQNLLQPHTSEDAGRGLRPAVAVTGSSGSGAPAAASGDGEGGQQQASCVLTRLRSPSHLVVGFPQRRSGSSFDFGGEGAGGGGSGGSSDGGVCGGGGWRGGVVACKRYCRVSMAQLVSSPLQAQLEGAATAVVDSSAAAAAAAATPALGSGSTARPQSFPLSTSYSSPPAFSSLAPHFPSSRPSSSYFSEVPSSSAEEGPNTTPVRSENMAVMVSDSGEFYETPQQPPASSSSLPLLSPTAYLSSGAFLRSTRPAALSFPPPTVSFCTSPLEKLTGLWVAPYGSHGLEILVLSFLGSDPAGLHDTATASDAPPQLSTRGASMGVETRLPTRTDSGETTSGGVGGFGGGLGGPDCGSALMSGRGGRLEGLKVVGDANVPAGRVSFSVDSSVSFDPQARLALDHRLVVAFPPEGAVIADLGARSRSISGWYRGKGQINRVQGVWDPDWVGIDFLVYDSGPVGFSVLWDEQGEVIRHIIDFVPMPLGGEPSSPGCYPSPALN